MDKFVNTCESIKLNQEHIKTLSNPITWNRIKTLIKYLPTKNSSGPNELNAKFYKNFRDLMPVILNFFFFFMKLKGKQYSQIISGSLHYPDFTTRQGSNPNKETTGQSL